MDALDGAEALAINTEWSEFRHPDMDEMRRRMAAPVIFDGRNLFQPQKMQRLGFTYHSIGRRSVEAG
jgi:UDPglucose 6-dehydrogenase